MDDSGPFESETDDELIVQALARIPPPATEPLPPGRDIEPFSILGLPERLREIRRRGIQDEAIRRGVPARLLSSDG
jgi:hypothetical protein